ncbi:MAG: 1-acyl-sn-glycerol-3-phosphate acyltransferase [Pseudomonadota bacterium]
MLRGVVFTGVYYALSVVYVLAALPCLLWPTRGPAAFVIRSYARAIRWALWLIAGVRTEARGKERLPDGPFIVAAKHQSWGDGFMTYPEVQNLAFVTGDHLEKFPLVGGILRKLGAIVIDTCGGGARKAASLAEGMATARAEGRRVLIYPEGHLAAVDHKFRYKPGVWHMYKAMNAPVVPVATNLGVFWAQEEMKKTPGQACIEFLEPIEPGLDKDAFLARLEAAVEGRTAELVAEARGRAPVEAVLLPDPDKGALAGPAAAATAEA